jgi:N-methylhydantoinase A
VPGPACTGRGGTEPTVTDANLILGRLSPRGLLDGDMPLDMEAARDAVGRIARRVGLSIQDTALGIVSIANAMMVGAMRTVSIQRGYDPRAFTLVPFGGAGPLHALALAEETGVRQVLVQPQPGIASALGLLVTDVRHDFSSTRVQPLAKVDPVELERSFADLERLGRAALEREAIAPPDQSCVRSIEMRYVGQSYQLVVPIQGQTVSPATIADLERAFHRMHEDAYGYAEPGEPMEVVNHRVTALGRIAKPQQLTGWGARDEHVGAGSRPVCFERLGFVDTAVHWRRALRVGERVPGPAVIEEHDSTTLVHPGWTALVTPSFDLMVTRSTPDSAQGDVAGAVLTGSR